jgi:hypothetical protein
MTSVFDQVADGLKNKLNVASVDCEANKVFCRRQEVLGYPTIRLSVDTIAALDQS